MPDLIFWGFILFLAYTYIGYPAFLAVIGSFRRRPQKQPGQHFPTVSVLIAAHNEEAGIADKIRNTLALEYPPENMEIVVASDGSADRTDEIIGAIAAGEPRVRLIRVEPRRGKTNAQNYAVPHCRGEVIVFSDATTIYHPEAVKFIACHYDDPSVGAVSGRYQYFDPEGTSPTGLGSIAFWNYENMIKKLQSRISTLTGCSGCIYSVRKSRYVKLPVEACSDLMEPLHIVKNGHRVVFEERALAYEETTRSAGQEFRMRVRVISRGILSILSMRELLNPLRYGWISFQLFSHKICRWMIPFSLVGIFISSALSGTPWIRYFFFLQLAFYTVGLISMIVPLHKKWKPLGIPLYVCTLIAALFVSVVKICRGQKFTVWETVRSS